MTSTESLPSPDKSGGYVESTAVAVRAGAASGSVQGPSGAKAWQFFLVLALIGATAAVWREPRFTRPEHLVLLSLAIVAAGFAAMAMHRTLLPLVSPERILGDTRRSARHLEALEREKRLVLRSIKELEFDKAMGKVAEADFDEMAGRLRHRAVGLMQRIDVGEAGLRDRIARDLAALPRSSRTASSARMCAACDTFNDRDARFCKACGGAL